MPSSTSGSGASLQHTSSTWNQPLASQQLRSDSNTTTMLTSTSTRKPSSQEIYFENKYFNYPKWGDGNMNTKSPSKIPNSGMRVYNSSLSFGGSTKGVVCFRKLPQEEGIDIMEPDVMDISQREEVGHRVISPILGGHQMKIEMDEINLAQTNIN